MLRKAVVCAAALLLLSSNAARAQDVVPSIECCGDILLPISARAVGLGQALVARAGNDGMFYNPATIADVRKTTFVVNHTSFGDPEETGTAQVNSFALLFRTKGTGFGLTYQSIDYGTDVATDRENNVIGETSQLSSILIATFATPLALGWTGGVSYHMYNFAATCVGVACESRKDGGTTHMLDAGVRWEPHFLKQLQVGASLMHFGPRLQVRNAEQADVTPARLRLGAAYNVVGLFTKDTATAAWVHVDVVQRVHDASTPGLNIGAEVSFDNVIFVRAGHAADANGASQGGTAVGIGMLYQRFDVSVAKSIGSQVFTTEPFYVSFGVKF